VTDPWARPGNQEPPVPAAGPPGQPTQQYPPGGPPPDYSGPPPSAPGEPGPDGSGRLKRFFRDPLSIVLVVVITLALVTAGLLGAELYARNRADTVVSKVTECVVQDSATASFGAAPPFLWQHMTGHYTNIHIETAGNQIRDTKGMKVVLDINDVRLEDTADSGGSIGALDADITWSQAGLKETLGDLIKIPFLGSVVSDVKTNEANGTIELESLAGTIVTKPTVNNGAISLQVTELSGFGLTLPKEIVQGPLDAFAEELIKGYPLGIKADSVVVTDSGIEAHLSTRNATIPKGNEDPCFADI
jgi:hypothetical protein